MDGETLAQALKGQGVLHMTMLAEWRADGERWSEVTRLLDLDPRGATLSLARCPEVGQLLHLRPRERFEGVAVGDEGIWALVWAVTRPGSREPFAPRAGVRYVASVIFFGDDVPRSFAEGGAETFGYVAEEEGVFRLRRAAAGGDGPDDNRRESRIYLPVELTAEALDAEGSVVDSGFAVTENISRHGAALRTTLRLAPGSRVLLKSERYNLALQAVVRASRAGGDSIGRLHVEFVEGVWPID